MSVATHKLGGCESSNHKVKIRRRSDTNITHVQDDSHLKPREGALNHAEHATKNSTQVHTMKDNSDQQRQEIKSESPFNVSDEDSSHNQSMSAWRYNSTNAKARSHNNTVILGGKQDNHSSDNDPTTSTTIRPQSSQSSPSSYIKHQKQTPSDNGPYPGPPTSENNGTASTSSNNDTVTTSSNASLPSMPPTPLSPAPIAWASSIPAVHLQAPAQHEKSHNQSAHKLSKGAVCGISIGCTTAFILLGAILIYMKRRWKRSSIFVRGRLRAGSNDSNRAVRDRSSLGAQFGATDPFACPSSFSKKPLLLRHQASGELLSKPPQPPPRPSLLNLRSQSLKSQISAPILEPPSPAMYRSMSGGSHGFSKNSCMSTIISPTSRQMAVSPSQMNFQELPKEDHHGRHQHRASLTRDPYHRRGSTLSVRNPDLEENQNDDKDMDPARRTQPAPARPPRPELSLLINSPPARLPKKPSRETQHMIPVTRPLNVLRRSQPGAGHIHRRSSIDLNILDPPTLSHDSGNFLPQYQREDTNPVFTSERAADLARISHLTRSTCYSQSSEGHHLVSPEIAASPAIETPTSLVFVSFGLGRGSEQSETSAINENR